MIITELYDGQGLGNQLWCYVVTRVIALDKGYDFGIKSPEKSKCRDFMGLDYGKLVIGGTGPEGGPPETLPEGIDRYFRERKIIRADNGDDVRIRDENLVNIPDRTKIDGCMQDEQYIIHRKNEIRQWLKIKKEHDCFDFSGDDICVINFRGGEYVGVQKFFLEKKYWENAINNMLKINMGFRFVVITDDVFTAKKFFPDYEVYHFNIAKDYAVIKNARYLIISNSSFAWFPAWLSECLQLCIAPKYWARHNVSDGYWSLGYNITTGWLYQDRDGKLFDYQTCLKELNDYNIKSNVRLLAETDADTLEEFMAIQRKYGTQTAPLIKRYVPAIIKRSLRKMLAKTNILKRDAPASWNYFMSFVNYLNPLRRRPSKQELAEYRKTIKVYDVFTFFQELDLLEIRLNILNEYVDYFVLIEATQTFSGEPKPLYYQDNKDRFKKWQHKIIHCVVNDVPADDNELRARLKNVSNDIDRRIITDTLTSPNIVPRTVVHWMKEFYIKESAKKALKDLGDNDICYISDLDEIWDPEVAIDYRRDDLFKLIQVPYTYYLNYRSNENWRGWTGTIATKYKNIKGSCINHLRTYIRNKYTYVRSGWHFSCQGGVQGVKEKILLSNNPDYYSQDVLDNLEKRVGKGQDYRGRKFKCWVDETKLPKFLLENKDKYKSLFK